MKSLRAFVLLLLVLPFIAGCTATLKPAMPYAASYGFEELSREDYRIKQCSGWAESWYVLGFPLRRDGLELKTAWPYPLRRGLRTCTSSLERVALHRALRKASCDVMLPYTVQTKVKGVPPFIWYQEVTVSGKAIEIIPDEPASQGRDQ